MRRRTRKKPVLQEKAEPYLYLLPTIVLFVFILAVPLFNLFKYSLGDSNIIQGFKGWNGFQNFAYLVSPKFLGSMWVTIVYVFFGVIGVVVCGTIVSLALDKPIPGRGVFRAIAIIPWVVPQAFAASMWSWVVNAQFGFINQLLRSMHLIENNLSFLSEHTALATVIVVRIWQGTPFMIISLLAALQTIPEDIQEAADLDGVTAFQRFRFITLPYIKPVLVTTTLIITAWTMQIFDTVYIMTAGGPARSTQLVALEIYAKAFQQDDLGTACAIALCVLGIIALLSLNNLKKERGDME
ncbi:sugar ABC transporter permease [Oscillospiraceae bacterium]|uniref:carbohydrate ABC transporter permease n=1 Tax=Allofournierella sp. TaxID=1940256 RepID=UPI0015B269A7|nr:sugar ABC transporter permease [Oscillospiraceae bacterium]